MIRMSPRNRRGRFPDPFSLICYFLSLIGSGGLVLVYVCLAPALMFNQWYRTRQKRHLEQRNASPDAQLASRRGDADTMLELLHADSEELVIQTVSEETGRCPVCATELEGLVVHCATCDSPHHEDCWQYTGHCAIFGCNGHQTREEGAGEIPQPFDMQGFEAVQERVSRWYWLLRVKWWFELSFWTSCAIICTLLACGQKMFGVFVVLPFAAAITAFLWVVSEMDRRQLEQSLDIPQNVPVERVNGLVRSIVESESRPILLKAARALPAVYIVVAIIAFYESVSYSLRGAPHGFLPLFILGGAACTHIVSWIAKRHQARLDQVRWRLDATLRAGRRALPDRS